MRAYRCTLLAFVVVTAAFLGNTPGLAQRPPAALFDRLDRNGDGKLTREEFPERFRTRFDRMDGNHDGSVSRREFSATRRQRPPQRAGRRAGQPSRVPAGVRGEFDIPYAGTNDPRQSLDLYLPEKPASKEPLPVVVWIHGGAWRAGNKHSGLSRLAPLVASGHYAGVSVGYRLTGQASWPAQIYDCKAAIRWIRAHAEKYHLDADKIGVWGSSAGGHLVAMLGTSGGVEQLEGNLGDCNDQSSRVQCVVDFFGPSNLLTMGDYPSGMDHNAPDSPESKLVGGPILQTKDVARAASPITYVSADDPPFLIVHGDRDMTVPYHQSVELHEALRKVGVDSTLITVKGGGHGFRTPEALRRVRAFLDKHLRGLEVEVPATPIEQSQK